MHIFKVGDWVYAGVDQWCYGQIVDFDGQEKDIAIVKYDTGTGGGNFSFDLEDLEPAEPPTKMKILPQYHFDRDAMCEVYYDVFTTDESIDIISECCANRHLAGFSLFWHNDEFYILHRESGVMINWYKHVGRTNTCNRPDFTLDDLREFLQKLRVDLVWAGVIKDEKLYKKLHHEFYEED